jgi:hypothetical protein
MAATRSLSSSSALASGVAEAQSRSGFAKRQSPASTGPFSRILFAKILDHHRPALAFEQAQCREYHAFLEPRVTPMLSGIL